ncbi:MAG TPA: lamin tail domain-containing protein, partial [Thermoguttaceae bacterium]|nr:lamin tail domain-containing protein [Thermoguttaceae bacterium]
MLRDIRRRAAKAGKALFSRNASEGSAKHHRSNRLTMETLEPRMLLTGVPATASNLMVTELNYNPYDYAVTSPNGVGDKEDFEFIEFQNVSDVEIDLTGVIITGSHITFAFTGSEITSLQPYEYVVVVGSEIHFAERYTTDRVAGEWGPDENLPDDGDTEAEQIILQDASGNQILAFDYRNKGNWPGRADGDGATAELISPTDARDITNQADRTAYLRDDDSWRASGEFGGSPGTVGRGPNN